MSKLIKYLWDNSSTIGAHIFFIFGSLIFYFSKDLYIKEMGIVILITSLWIKLDVILKKEIIVNNYFINRDTKVKVTADSIAISRNELLDAIEMFKKNKPEE